MKDHVFGHGTIMSMFGSLDRLKVAKGEEEGKGKDQGRLKRIGNAYLGEEQTEDNGREENQKKAFQKERANFQISIHALFLKEKVPTRSSSQTNE